MAAGTMMILIIICGVQKIIGAVMLQKDNDYTKRKRNQRKYLGNYDNFQWKRSKEYLFNMQQKRDKVLTSVFSEFCFKKNREDF